MPWKRLLHRLPQGCGPAAAVYQIWTGKAFAGQVLVEPSHRLVPIPMLLPSEFPQPYPWIRHSKFGYSITEHPVLCTGGWGAVRRRVFNPGRNPALFGTLVLRNDGIGVLRGSKELFSHRAAVGRPSRGPRLAANAGD